MAPHNPTALGDVRPAGESTGDVIRAEYDPEGDFGEKLAVKRYADTPLGDKRLIVAYREVHADDGFVVTVYLARGPSARREIVWRRP